jgi:cytoskeleton protein RodZ
MSQEDTPGDAQTLGAFLREHRERINVSLEDVTESTKISLPILRAIEEDDYDRLPAEAFCRGFYSMYADFLQLNPEEILKRYLEDRGQPSRATLRRARPPIKKSRHFSNYAEPTPFSPAASLGMLLLACFIAVVGVCWYFDCSPIKYISTQLTTSPIIEEPVQSEIETLAVSDPDKDLPVLNSKQETLSSDSAGETTIAPFHLVLNLTSNGTLNVTLDDGVIIEKHFTSGETLRWEAEKKILLEMPEEISVTLRLNGVERPLPQAENGRRRLSLP